VKIGVVGSKGVVGKAVKYTLSYYYNNVVGYDIQNEGSFNDVLDADIVFVCVHSSFKKEGRLDCSIIDSILTLFRKNIFKGVIAIKSTVCVGYMNEASIKFPNLRLVYMPEFLRKKSAFTWFLNPDRIVIAGKREDIEKVLDVFSFTENAKILTMDYKTAEIAKLAHNAFIATKVSFTNEIEKICHKLGAEPSKVMECICTDRRVGSSEHLKPRLGPYGGKCVPKDTLELINAYGESIVLKAVHEFNEALKKERESYE